MGDCMGLLKSPDVIIATTAIVDKGKTKAEVQQEIKKKEAAVKRLVRRFSNDDVSEENIEWCLYSIGDNSAFLVFNRDPVDQMIGYLTSNFPADLALRPHKISNDSIWIQGRQTVSSTFSTVSVLFANSHI